MSIIAEMALSKEILSYIIFGVLTTLINLLVFFVCDKFMHYQIANLIAFIVSVLFAFFTNKFYVFNSNQKDLITYSKEFLLFLFARLGSYFLEVFLLLVMVGYLHIGANFSKLITNIIVIVLNYIFSKFIIFKKEIL